MLYFLIIPVWFLVVIAGLVMLLSSQHRWLSTYLILSSTLGVLVSIILSTLPLLFLPRIFEALGQPGIFGGVIVLASYLGGMVIGGVVGLPAGALLARKVNRRLRWAKMEP
ncbi:MAG TPA: hypothetical protein VFR05_10210 [Terriglobia bacterium]|nr:hypothetical protein [Terriglobia bacterium]